MLKKLGTSPCFNIKYLSQQESKDRDKEGEKERGEKIIICYRGRMGGAEGKQGTYWWEMHRGQGALWSRYLC